MQFHKHLKNNRRRVLRSLRIARRRGEQKRVADLRRELLAVRSMLRGTFEAQAVEQAYLLINDVARSREYDQPRRIKRPPSWNLIGRN